MKIDRSNWKKVKFEEVVTYKKLTVDPETSGLMRYIAGDHMTKEDLHLRRWGKIGEGYLGPAFHSKFEKGDILYGSRRTYLKKVAIADFDGITSNTTFVLKENNDNVVPGLVPFMMLSDNFTEHSVKNSKGSVNPYINFKDIGKFEFHLPPKDQQIKIAELLLAGDEVIERYFDEKQKIAVLSKIFVKNALRKGVNKGNMFLEKMVPTEFQTSNILIKVPTTWKLLSLGEVIENSQNGFAEGGRTSVHGLWQLRMNNVTRDCTLDLSDVITIPRKDDLSRYQIETGDVLFNNTNSEELVGKTVYFETVDREMVFSNHFTRLRANPKLLLQKYLQIWLKYHFQIGLFQRRCTKWIGQAAVQNENLLSLKILLPTIDEQLEIVATANVFEKNILELENLIDKTRAIQKQLINQIF